VTVLLVVVLGLVAAGIAASIALAASRGQAAGELTPGSPAFRNHQRMARWIERRLDDDMVRPLLREDDQAEGRRLLDEFYGEDR